MVFAFAKSLLRYDNVLNCNMKATQNVDITFCFMTVTHRRLTTRVKFGKNILKHEGKNAIFLYLSVR
jgi:hypothetical protein